MGFLDNDNAILEQFSKNNCNVHHHIQWTSLPYTSIQSHQTSNPLIIWTSQIQRKIILVCAFNCIDSNAEHHCYQIKLCNLQWLWLSSWLPPQSSELYLNWWNSLLKGKNQIRPLRVTSLSGCVQKILALHGRKKKEVNFEKTFTNVQTSFQPACPDD